MNTHYKLFKIGTVIGYVTAFFYALLTALLYSVSNLFYILNLIFAIITLYNSLFTSYLNQYVKTNEVDKKKKIYLYINLGLSILSPLSFTLYLIALLLKRQDRYTAIENESYKDDLKERKEKRFYKKGNFILSCASLALIVVSSFSAQLGETSAYSVKVRDFTLNKEMTEKYNQGAENALNGENYVIESDVLKYSVTEYKPKSASETNPLPVVFVMPGFTRTKATMAQYAIELSKRGAIVFTIDPGSQGSTTYAGYDENGEMISATVAANGLDYLVQYVYNNVDDYNYIDRDAFGVVGHSAGGGNACQVAEDFAGDTYSTSIIKALYISGYIKNSAANRFKNLRCNAAMSYAYYDEGAFRYQGSTSAFEVIARRFVNEVNGLNNNYDEAIIDYEYGDMREGSYRVIHQEPINHCFEMYDPLSISNTLNFFRRTLNLNTELDDRSQTWFVKEGFNGLALVSAFVFIFALLGFLIDVLPLFKSFRVKALEVGVYEDSKKIQYQNASPESLARKRDYSPEQIEQLNNTKQRKKKYIDKVLFWSITCLTAIVACLDYIPLARLTMSWFSSAASNTYTFFFPARMMNAVMLWALFNGLLGLFLIFTVKLVENLYYKLTNQSEYISWYRYQQMKIHWKDLLKSIATAVVFFLLFYFLVFLMYSLFHQDFRFTLISASKINSRMFVTWLIYLLPFFVFYLSNSVRVNLSMATEGWKEWQVVLASSLANSIGLVFILIINYYVYFTTGTVFYGYYSPTDSSEMWLFINMIFGLIPVMFVLPILNRYCFKKSGNVYLGSMLTCMIFIMMSISASVSYIPM